MNMNRFILHKNKALFTCLCIILCFVNVASATAIDENTSTSPLNNPPTIKVAIVIDDIGYRATDKQVLLLPGNITYSILPHTPYGKTIAQQAFNQHKDILLHIPMESMNGKKLGPGALTKEMNRTDIHLSLDKSFNEIPFAIGINNHMGSYLTKSVAHMAWTMSFLKSHDLFFLDSKTSVESKAGKVASILGVPVQERQVFLDNEKSLTYISKQFKELILTAQNNKSAIAIAHPHPESMRALQALIPTLKDYNIELVPLSELYVDTQSDKGTVIAESTPAQTKTPPSKNQVALSKKAQAQQIQAQQLSEQTVSDQQTFVTQPIYLPITIPVDTMPVKALVLPEFSVPSDQH